MRTDLHTKTAIRRNAAGAAPLLIAVIALILSGCNLSSPAGFIKDQMARGTGRGGEVTGLSADDEDFGPGLSPDSTITIASGSTTLYAYLNGIKGIPGNHVVNLSGGQTHNFSGNITLASGVNISLRGTTADIVCISGYYGVLFTINTGATLILRGPTLHGVSGNNASVVKVNGGAFYLRGGDITGNTGAFYNGGGVNVASGTFTMSGGTISGNNADLGGGVLVAGGSFTMGGGTISANNANSTGGGVHVTGGGSFNKIGGTVTGTGGPNSNNATGNGKAVYVSSGPKYRNITAGPGDTVDTATDIDTDGYGFWQH